MTSDDPEFGVDGQPTVSALVADLESLGTQTDSREVKSVLRETEAVLRQVSNRGLIDPVVRRVQARDAAEAVLGCVVFATPLLVEDGIHDIAAFLLAVTWRGIPVFLGLNIGFVILITYALVEWTGRDKYDINSPFSVLPLRVIMILVVSFVVSAVLMTVWGRVDGWVVPVEAFSRVTVLWTIGSIGAALGDIVSGNKPPEHVAVRADHAGLSSETDGSAVTAAGRDLSDPALMVELHEQFDRLVETLDAHDEADELPWLTTLTNQPVVDAVFGDRINKYTGRDIAEAFVGSVIFSIPLLVEDGVFDVATYFLSFRIGQFPVFFLINLGVVLFLVAALVYWTGPQRVQISRPLFGFIPRRLVGIAIVAFLTASMLMTMWGRVDWADPTMAIARISVVWAVASFGAALGDILPGESSGDDINDDLADLTDHVEALVDTRG